MKNKKSIIFGVVITLLCILAIFFLAKSGNLKSESGNLIKISAKKLFEKIENKDSFILLVSKEGCSHCAEYEPVFINVLERNDLTAYKIDLADFNTDDRKKLADVANISGTPTTAFIKDGEEETVLNRIVGSANRKTIESRLKSLGYIE